MSNKKLKTFKFFPEVVQKISNHSRKYEVPETTLIESLLENFFSLPEGDQKKILAKYLTRNLNLD